MVTYFIIAILILLLGVLSYFTSAWFGVKASNTGKIPPYYENLLRQLREKEKRDKASNNAVNEYESSTK